MASQHAWLSAGAAMLLAAGLSGARTQSNAATWRVTSIAELKSISRITVTVANIGASATACSWSVPDIQSAATRPWADASIRVVDGLAVTGEAGAPTLAVGIMARSLSDSLCVGYLSVDLVDLSTAVVPSYAQDATTFLVGGRAAGPYALFTGEGPDAPPRTVRAAIGDVRLRSSGGLLSGTPSAFSQGAVAQVGRLVAAIVAEVKRANQG